jgi:hypothetical protein
MAEVINIQSLNPTTFEFQNYTDQDTSLITNFETQTSFDSKTDKVEYFIYDLNNQIIYSDNDYPDYVLNDNNLVLDPGKNLIDQGYFEGNYNTVYNFVKPILASSPTFPYFISQISADSTEIRLDTTSIPNNLVISSSQELINNINNSTGSYYDFYLNFGNNDLIIAVNALLDTSSIDNPTVLIKLYEPLPSQFVVNSQCWVVTQVAEPVAYNIQISQIFEDLDLNIPLKGPNFNINLQNEINNSTDYVNYTLLSSATSSYSQGTGSLQYQLNNLLAQRGISINIDYSDYSNFIHFSSAQTRLENFYYKLSLLEQYQYSASYSDGISSDSYYVSSSNIIWQKKIDEIITGFDNYEYYLYYSSGSTAWPKTNNTPPYINTSTSSVAGQNWFISQSLVAEEYDLENNNALILAIPDYILDDPNNLGFELFIEMIGQMFDNVFVYYQDVTNKYDADNRLNYGVSKDLVVDILRDLGLKIYQNNFSSNDLYQALIGITPSGSLYNLPYTTTQVPVPTGSFLDYITTYVTASSTSSLIPTDDINKSFYKRLYHNLPYLLKKKGSVEGLRALITTFGIPDTILRINEFGGKDKNVSSFDNWQDEYNYAFYTSGSSYITSSFVLNSSWGASSNRPAAVEFRFKTDGLPFNTASVASQSLWSTENGVNLVLRYTGSGYTSGSYSGSTKDPYYQYALLDFLPSTSSLNTSASVYLPFYDGGWWSVLVNSSSTGFTLYAGNKNYKGEDGNVVGFQASSSITGSNVWTASLVSTFGSASYKTFTGSFQEIRYYTKAITKDNFDAYLMNPYSTEQSEYLAFRATLGGELYTASISVHPKVTGSWIATSSFASNSNFFISSGGEYIPNTEVFFFDQVPAGIQNAVSDKIKQQGIILPYSSSNTNIPNANTLSPFRSIQQDFSISQSYTRDIDYVEVAFSPQNEINEDINSTFGYFNIGELIGDPRFQSSSLDLYPDLNALNEEYFLKYKSNYDWNDYIRLIKFFDNSLFKMISDWVPARTDLASGIVIKNTLLDRNRYRTPQVNTSESIANIGSGSTNIPYVVEDQTITGSIISGFITGSNGGVMPDLFGQTSSVYDYNNVVNITQSWTGTTPSTSGSVPFTQVTQEEFFNGQLSGSNLVVTTGSLGDCNVEILQVFSTSSLPSSAINSFQGYYLNTFNFNPSKTYYLTFTETNNVAASNAGALLIYDSSDLQGNLRVLYSGSALAPGASRTVTNLEVQGVVPPIVFSKTEFLASIEVTNFIISEAYIEPDCDVLAGNAVVSRPSTLYYDVDFTTNQITAVNEQSILNKSATRATVPDSYYTTARIVNPRYKGSRTTTPGFNLLPITGSGIGQKPNVEQLGSYFIYYDWIGGASPEIKNGYNVHVKLMIDELGNVVNPSDISSSYYYNLIDSFGENTSASLTLYNNAGSTGGSTLYRVIKPGVEAWPVIYTDSGSLGIGALSSINFYRSSSVTPSITVTNTYQSNFFVTGALSPLVLTSSTDPGVFGAVGLPSVYNTGLYPNINLFGNVPNPPYAQTPVAGTGFNEPLSFTINPGDELRVSGSEGLVWQIVSSSFQPGADPSIDKSYLYVYLDHAYNGPHPINYFLIRRYVPNPSLVIINSTSSVVNAAGATGFLSPRYVSSTIQRDFNSIVQDLSSKNLI